MSAAGRLEGDAGQGGTDQGQQLGVGGAGRQVEAGGRAAGEVAVAGRQPAGGRGQHDGPGATAGDHDADGRERLPGAAHGRGADAEVGGEGADGREPVAGPQVTASDEARHGRRDAARAAVVDVGGEVHAGQDARRGARARGGRPRTTAQMFTWAAPMFASGYPSVTAQKCSTRTVTFQATVPRTGTQAPRRAPRPVETRRTEEPYDRRTRRVHPGHLDGRQGVDDRAPRGLDP